MSFGYGVGDLFGTARVGTASGNTMATIGSLLLGGGAQFDTRRALQAAARGEQEVVVDQLIKAGADINSKSRHNHPALTTAVEQGHEAIVEMLCRCERQGAMGYHSLESRW